MHLLDWSPEGVVTRYSIHMDSQSLAPAPVYAKIGPESDWGVGIGLSVSKIIVDKAPERGI